MVVVDALDLNALAVYVEAVRFQAEGADAEGRLVAIDRLSILRHRGHGDVPVRRLPRGRSPEARIRDFDGTRDRRTRSRGDDRACGLSRGRGVTRHPSLGIEREYAGGDGDLRIGPGVVIDRDFQIDGGGTRRDLGRGYNGPPLADVHGPRLFQPHIAVE